MTTPAHEPLWDNCRIAHRAADIVLISSEYDEEIMAAMYEIREEYEAVLAFDRTRYAEQLQRIAELEQQLAEALKRKPMRVVTQPDFVIDLDDD